MNENKNDSPCPFISNDGNCIHSNSTRNASDTRLHFCKPGYAIYILLADFVFPYRGGGASMFPIDMIFGAFYGVFAGGVGAIASTLFLKIKKKDP